MSGTPISLKPCPFCGGPAKLSISEEGPYNELYRPPYAQVFCTQCPCAKTPIRATKEWEAGRGYFSVEASAVAYVTDLWNRRALGMEDARDGERFRWCQNNPKEAQAMFWNYSSRRERAKAIDSAMSKDRSHD